MVNVTTNATAGTHTIINSGWYKIMANISWTSSLNQLFEINYFVNGVQDGHAESCVEYSHSGDVVVAVSSGISYLNAGDVVDLRVTCSSAGSQTVTFIESNFQLFSIAGTGGTGATGPTGPTGPTSTVPGPTGPTGPTGPAATIPGNSVTNAMLAQMPALTAKVNLSTSTANASDQSLGYINMGLNNTMSCNLISVVNQPSMSGTVTIDGVSAANLIVLLVNQTTASQNGLWLANSAGAWTRPPSYPSGQSITQNATFIATGGTLYAGARYYITSSSGTIDSSSIAFALVPSSITYLSANTTVYVSTVGSDTANDGLTISNAFATVQHALNQLSRIHLNGYTYTVALDATTGTGSWTGQAINSVTPVGYFGAGPVTASTQHNAPSSIFIQGNTTSASSYTLTGGSTYNVINIFDKGYALSYFTVTAGSGLNCIAGEGCWNLTVGNIIIGGGLYGISGDNYAFIDIIGNITVTGNLTYGLFNSGYGSIMLFTTALTVACGTHSILTVCSCGYNSMLNLSSNVTWTGTVTGTKYFAQYLSCIINGVANIPGSIAGSATTGSQTS